MIDSNTEGQFIFLPELNKGVEEILLASNRAHLFFEQEKWNSNSYAYELDTEGKKNKPAYHTTEHLRATLECMNVIYEQSMSDNDPFSLNDDLQRFNSTLEGIELDQNDLRAAFSIAFACHDLGNITSTDSVQWKGGTVNLDYADHYKSSVESDEVEQRSAAISQTLIERFVAQSYKKKDSLKKLVSHLILQTAGFHKFDGEEAPQPFSRVMQYVDQLGSAYFDERDYSEMIAGLFNEMMVVEKSGDVIRRPKSLASCLRFPIDAKSRLLAGLSREAIQNIDNIMDKETVENLAQYAELASKQIPDQPVVWERDIEVVSKLP